jgi:hypothetical protein
LGPEDRGFKSLHPDYNISGIVAHLDRATAF